MVEGLSALAGKKATSSFQFEGAPDVLSSAAQHILKSWRERDRQNASGAGAEGSRSSLLEALLSSPSNAAPHQRKSREQPQTQLQKSSTTDPKAAVKQSRADSAPIEKPSAQQLLPPSAGEARAATQDETCAKADPLSSSPSLPAPSAAAESPQQEAVDESVASLLELAKAIERRRERQQPHLSGEYSPVTDSDPAQSATSSSDSQTHTPSDEAKTASSSLNKNGGAAEAEDALAEAGARQGPRGVCTDTRLAAAFQVLSAEPLFLRRQNSGALQGRDGLGFSVALQPPLGTEAREGELEGAVRPLRPLKAKRTSQREIRFCVQEESVSRAELRREDDSQGGAAASFRRRRKEHEVNETAGRSALCTPRATGVYGPPVGRARLDCVRRRLFSVLIFESSLFRRRFSACVRACVFA